MAKFAEFMKNVKMDLLKNKRFTRKMLKTKTNKFYI